MCMYDISQAEASPGRKMWGGHARRACGVRAYNGGLGTEPQWGPGAEPLVRRSGAKHPLEAENVLVFGAQRKQQICFILQTMTATPNLLLLPSKNSLDLHQSQERPLAKVGWTCPPQSTPWRRPCSQEICSCVAYVAKAAP